jgi:DNA helicase HerA-like ATPase
MGTGQHPWQVLSRLPAWQVIEVPRPSRDHSSLRDMGAAQRVQALVSAYGCADPLAMAWVRDRAGGPVRVLAAGPGLAGGQDDGQAVLTLPAGARGAPLPDGEMARVLIGVPCWTRLAGVTDVLLADSGGRAGPDGLEMPPSLEDGLLSAWLDGFAWLLLAEPVAETELNDLAADAALVQLAAERLSSPRAKLAARRAAARHDELRQAATAGLWRVHLLAGAAIPTAAARVARLICASVNLRGLPYALSAGAGTSSLPDALTAGRTVPVPAVAAREAVDERDTPAPQSPFLGSTRLVAALARAPTREVPGLRFTLRPEFDVTPETAPAVPDASLLTAGLVLDWNRVPAGMLALPAASLNRHVFVCGATGAGKSQTVRNLLEQATKAGIPWLVVEPAKAEYRLMAARLPGAGVIAIRPGDLGQPAAGINPLEPALGPGGARFPLQTHADLLRALFLAAFQADEPFPQVLAAALARCYEQAGWDLVTGQSAAPGVQPSYPSLEDLQAAAMTVVNQIGYGREVADNVRGFVTVRIGSLRLGTTGRFLDGGHPLDFTALLDRNVVLEIEDAGDDHDKAFLMGAMLIRLVEHLRLRHRHEGPALPRLRHLTVVEEAHRLLRQPPPGAAAGPAAHATEMFADLLAEIRAYGEGLIIAEQIPAKLIPDVIKNTAVKIVHRLPAADDRATVGATMNLHDAQSEYLVTLPPGQAAVHADGMDYPLLARMPDGTGREASQAARITSPEPVIGRRSLTCGPDCTAGPCTLGQMRAAQRAAITDPRVTMWAELAVLAHLTGWDLPRPSPVFTDSLRAMQSRLRDCTISHAADAAVAARAPAINTRVSPAALGAHVVTAMRQVISDGAPGCAAEEPEYLAPPFRWTLVRDALRSSGPLPGEGRHPRSDEWERTYGQPVPGRDTSQQARMVTRWYARDQRDTQAVTTVIWGIRPRTAIEQAAGSRAGTPDWPAQLTEMLAAFAKAPWPLALLGRSLPRSRAATRKPGDD